MDIESTERYQTCLGLYISHNGKQLRQLEREMRAKGFATFCHRVLHGRNRNGIYNPGWIVRFKWKEKLGPEPPRLKQQQTADQQAFQDWLKAVSPGMTWDWKYQKLIYERLQRVTTGECKRLMIFLPPRHGKSELVTVRYAGWRLWNDPKLRVIVGSYNQKLADKFSRSIRRLLSEEEDKLYAPPSAADAAISTRPANESKVTRGRDGPVCKTETLTRLAQPSDGRMFPRSRTINTVSQWETALGGGVKAVGVGAGVTGFGAQLVVIDDPVKNRAEAESETLREKVWDWYRNDLYTRLEPNGSVILIQTRWHEDDLAGRLLQDMNDGGDDWEIVNLPALAETTADSREIEEIKTMDVLERGPGEALCPERYNEKALDDIRRQIGSYAFSALYQQRPTPAEGGLFKRAWFTRFVEKAPDGLRWKRGYDLAVSTKTAACYTSSFRVAFDADGNLYIADGFRKRIEYPEQRRFLLERIAEESDTEHGIEKALHGQALIQDLRKEPGVRGANLKGVAVTTDKVTRALKWAPLAEEGKVILVRGPWNKEFLDEVGQFPRGQFDDQVDAVSLAVAMFRINRTPYGF